MRSRSASSQSDWFLSRTTSKFSAWPGVFRIICVPICFFAFSNRFSTDFNHKMVPTSTPNRPQNRQALMYQDFDFCKDFTLPYRCNLTLRFHPPGRVKSAGPHAQACSTFLIKQNHLHNFFNHFNFQCGFQSLFAALRQQSEAVQDTTS